jgi:hypothetical protein
MAENGKKTTKNALYLAEFDNPASCLHAAEKLRDAGYKHFDAHTPFPVHGMDKAMGLSDSRLGWISLVCGLAGVTTAWTMMWWMNGIDYPLIVGGKPPYSLPSMVPIMFELTVLFTCIGTVLGMLHMNRLPRHNHPIFESERFHGVSDDKFFVSIAAEDPKFHLEKTKALLESCQPDAIELVKEEL